MPLPKSRSTRILPSTLSKPLIATPEPTPAAADDSANALLISDSTATSSMFKRRCTRRNMVLLGLAWATALFLVAVLTAAAGSTTGTSTQATAGTSGSVADAAPVPSAASAGVTASAAPILKLLHPHAADKGARLWDTYLQPLLVPRVPGTPTHADARSHIVRSLQELGWSIELDTFNATTPLGVKPFSNIIATRHPAAQRKLVLAAHYDSKILAGTEFIGATDSAAPCAMLLEIAALLKPSLDAIGPQAPSVSLQLIFFDGEEAFKDWSSTDSLYGSRHLATKWAETFVVPEGGPDGTAAAAVSGPAAARDLPAVRNMLQSITAFVLLDLLGPRAPTIYNLQRPTAQLFSRLVALEGMLRNEKQLYSTASSTTKPYFHSDLDVYTFARIDDDHRPFLERGVPVVHVIPVDFPEVWHTPKDNASALDRDTVLDLTRVFAAFAIEQLGLRAP